MISMVPFCWGGEEKTRNERRSERVYLLSCLRRLNVLGLLTCLALGCLFLSSNHFHVSNFLLVNEGGLDKMVYKESFPLSTQHKSSTERLGNGEFTKWERTILKVKCWHIQWG